MHRRPSKAPLLCGGDHDEQTRHAPQWEWAPVQDCEHIVSDEDRTRLSAGSTRPTFPGIKAFPLRACMAVVEGAS